MFFRRSKQFKPVSRRSQNFRHVPRFEQLEDRMLPSHATLLSGLSEPDNGHAESIDVLSLQIGAVQGQAEPTAAPGIIQRDERVPVQFLWDRLGDSDTNKSNWVRVSELWAGKQWGLMSIPLIGQETIVDFMLPAADFPPGSLDSSNNSNPDTGRQPDDRFQDFTPLPALARGGNGNDTLLGGSEDVVIGGRGQNLPAPNPPTPAPTEPHGILVSASNSVLPSSFYASGSQFAGGVFVAAGDVNGDGRTDVIIGSGAGPHVVSSCPSPLSCVMSDKKFQKIDFVIRGDKPIEYLTFDFSDLVIVSSK